MTVHDNTALLELARALFLDNPTCDANDFLDAVAFANDIALQTFVEKYSDPFPGPFSLDEMESFVSQFGQTLRPPRSHRVRARAKKGVQ